MRRLRSRTVRLALLAGIALAGAYSAPLLSLQTAAATVVPGDSGLLTVTATGITDLYAFQFDLNFASGVLAAEAVDEGPFLARGGTTLFVSGTISNSTGTIPMTVDTLVGPVPGVSGDGPLAGISFRPVGAGTSLVTLSHVILLDSHLSEVIASSTGASINVVPEPNLFPLLTLVIVFRRIIQNGF